jgi:hypothetical protein
MGSDEKPSMSKAELRAIWRDPHIDSFSREESLWEFWRQTVEDGARPSDNEVLEIFTIENKRVPDVVGLLAQKALLSQSSLTSARQYLATHDGNPWLTAQLDAREMLMGLARGERVSAADLCDALVRKGTFWAVLEAVPVLPPEHLGELIRISEERRVFTRGQRHHLQTVVSEIRRREQDPDRG